MRCPKSVIAGIKKNGLGITQAKGTSAAPKICWPGCVGGPAINVTVAGVHIYEVEKPPDGAMVTCSDGPSGLKQGIILTTLPPKEVPNAAEAASGAKNVAASTALMTIERNIRIFRY